MTNIRIEAEALIQELHAAAEAYYQQDGESNLTDEEFDAKSDLLETYAQDPAAADLFATGTKGWKLLENDVSLGTKIASSDVVHHSSPMLSLGKAKKKEELAPFLSKVRAAGATDFRLQVKLDGFALSASYKNGSIAILATRGEGHVGEDVSYLLKDPNVTLVGLPSTIPSTEDIEVRGELFFRKEQFEAADAARVALTGENFKNPRNSIVGLMKKAKLGVSYPVTFTFAAYSIYKNGELDDLALAAPLGFEDVDAITEEQAPNNKLTDFEDDEDLFKAVEAFGVTRKGFTIPTDGVVIKPTNEAEMMRKMGSNSHHPYSQIAYKYPGEWADSTVLAISVTVGKTGKLTPCAHIKAVHVDGSVIENFTMNNYNWVAEKDVRVGSEVRVHKANDTIPEIKLVLHNPPDSTPVTVPTNCPVCDSVLAYDSEKGFWPPKTIKCENDECPSRDFFALKTAVTRNFLDIDGLSEASLARLNDSGRVNNIADLFTLTLDELAPMTLSINKQGNPIRLGESRAQNILDHLEKAKSLPFYRQLMALNIAHMGPSTAKALIAHYTTLEAIQAATVEEIAELDGFGKILAEKIVRGFALRKELIERLQSLGMNFDKGSATQAGDNAAHLAGLSFAISGEVPGPFANRNAWVEYIEANGGAFHSSPKATTSYMVGDEDATSSKAVAAKKHGVPFISPADWTTQFVK